MWVPTIKSKAKSDKFHLEMHCTDVTHFSLYETHFQHVKCVSEFQYGKCDDTYGGERFPQHRFQPMMI